MAVKVIYWSASGNTQQMAEKVALGAGVDAVEVDSISPEEALAADVLALGCPAMGDEVLEEGSFEPFIEKIEGKLQGKKVALFGSYDWGDGEWMRQWADRMKQAGAQLHDDGLIVNLAPDDDAQAQCEALGKALAAWA